MTFEVPGVINDLEVTPGALVPPLVAVTAGPELRLILPPRACHSRQAHRLLSVTCLLFARPSQTCRTVPPSCPNHHDRAASARGRTGDGANKWLEMCGFKDVKMPGVLVSLQDFIFRAR